MRVKSTDTTSSSSGSSAASSPVIHPTVPGVPSPTTSLGDSYDNDIRSQLYSLQQEIGQLKSAMLLDTLDADTNRIREYAADAKRAVSSMILGHEQMINQMTQRHAKEVAALKKRAEELEAENAILKESLALLASQHHNQLSGSPTDYSGPING
jgi:hypothetical protein